VSQLIPRPEGWPENMTWPPGESLDDAFDKLRWAKKHLEALRIEVEAVEKRDTHSVSFKADVDARKYSFYVHDLEGLGKTDWPLMIGDCLHNARTALDYLMVRLFALVTGEEPRAIGTVQFPIYDKPKRFNGAGAVTEARKHPAFSGYLARIEELQPFNRGNISIWGSEPGPITQQPVMHQLPVALDQLSALDNIDKHRVVHATWLGIEGGRLHKDPFRETSLSIPEGFDLRGRTTNHGPLENGAEVGSVQFDSSFPADWNPSEMEMKREFPLQVAFADDLRFPNGVLEVLGLCLWGVEAVLAIFGPVFTKGVPPLPVTAVPNR
jgi:hypothetical protein